MRDPALVRFPGCGTGCNPVRDHGPEELAASAPAASAAYAAEAVACAAERARGGCSRHPGDGCGGASVRAERAVQELAVHAMADAADLEGLAGMGPGSAASAADVAYAAAFGLAQPEVGRSARAAVAAFRAGGLHPAWAARAGRACAGLPLPLVRAWAAAGLLGRDGDADDAGRAAARMAAWAGADPEGMLAAWAAAGYGPAEAARSSALPAGHPDRPTADELAAMAGLAAAGR